MRKPITFGALRDLFLKNCDVRVVNRSLRPSSRRLMERRLDHAAHLFDRRVTDLGPAQFAKVLAVRTPSMAREVYRTVRQAFLWGLTKGLVTQDPLRDLYVPRPTPKPGEPFSREEVLQFIAACVDEKERRLRGVVHLGRLAVARHTATSSALHVLALTGARSEAIGMSRHEDFNQAARTLRVWTKGEARTLSIARPVAELLATQQRLVHGRHEFLFPGRHRTGLTNQSINQAFRRIRVLAKLPPRRHANDLRHTAITLMRRAGASWCQAAEFALHRDPGTTRRFYDHTDVTPSTLAAADTFAAFLGFAGEEVDDA